MGGQKATPEKKKDMLTFRQIGEQSFQHYVKHRILQQPSTDDAPLQRQKLLTMATVKHSRRKASQKLKEAQQVSKCLRRRLAFCNRTGQCYDSSQEQYSVYPRALADEEGYPHKASKSKWTDKLRSRYQSTECPPVTRSLPSAWMPQVTIIDAMFLINTKPLRKTKTIAEYAQFLFNRYALEQYQSGVSQVHLVFDKPGQQKFNPKQFQHTKRDKRGSSECTQHEHITFSPQTATPSGWQQYLQCRLCKRSLIKLLVLHTYRKEVQCFAAVKHWFLQVAFLGKEKTMHGSSKLAKSLRQV